MAADDQNSKVKDSPRCAVKVNGQDIPADYNLVSLVVCNELGRLATARLMFLDGDAATKTFPVSNKPDFLPGSTISIEPGYDGNSVPVYKGIVVRQSVKLSHNKSTFLVVDCRHVAVKMTKVRKSKIFADQKDSDIFSSIARKNSVTIDAEDTSVTHRQMVQFNCSDWDFIVTRAEANGLIVWGDNDKLIVKKPVLSAEPVMDLSFGVNLLEFDGEMDGRYQFGKVTATGWDQTGKKPVEANGSTPGGFSQQGNVSQSDLASKTGDDAIVLRHGAFINESELRSWADAQQLKFSLSKIRGRARCAGSEKLMPGVMVNLAGVGDRFNGKALVAGVRHEISEGTWTTDVQFGLAPDLFIQRADVNEQPASGMLSGVHGLQVGVVKQLQEDPMGEDRVLVKMPMTDDKADGVWARHALLDAGKERGSFFRPEVGDEVILGFINDDPRHPVILGMLNSSALPAVMQAKDTNHEKGIVTREKLKVWFNDEKKIITLSTQSGNSVVLSEDEKKIALKDEHGNEIIMDKNGITIKSIKDIVLDASSGAINSKANQIESKANSSLKMNGSGTAELSSGGTTTVKGSMVQIN